MAVYVANSGADTLEGGDGHDGLWGADGNNHLLGGVGSDGLVGGHAEHSDLVNRARPRIDEVDHRCGDALESAVDKKRLERSEAQDPKAFELQLVALCRIEIKDPVCSVALPEDEGVGAGAPEEKVEAGAAADRIRPALAELVSRLVPAVSHTLPRF